MSEPRSSHPAPCRRRVWRRFSLEMRSMSRGRNLAVPPPTRLQSRWISKMSRAETC